MADAGKSNEDLQVIICRIAGQDYGIQIAAIREITRLESPTHLPSAPAFLRGVINFRGKCVPVIDLRELLGLELAEYTVDSRNIVLDLNDQTVGFVVDAVTEVVTLSGDAIDEGDGERLQFQGRYVAGIAHLDERPIILLRAHEMATALSVVSAGERSGSAAAFAAAS